MTLSTAEAEYVAAGSCCTQVLWLKCMLEDYKLQGEEITTLCDNTSTINITKNHVQHERTKHIETGYHFIRDLVEKKILEVSFVRTKHQIQIYLPNTLTSRDFIN